MGILVGKTIDQTDITYYYSKTVNTKSLLPGTPLKLYITNGNIVEGKFLRLEKTSELEYASKYNSNRDALVFEAMLPALNSTIYIDKIKRSQKEFAHLFIYGRPDMKAYDAEGYTLIGFDWGCLRSISNKTGDSTTIELENIMVITGENNKHITKTELMTKIVNGEVPFISYLIVETESAVLSVSREEIERAKIYPGKNGRTLGVFLGDIIDIACVAVAYRIMDQGITVGL